MLLGTLSISTYTVNAFGNIVFIKLPQTDMKVGSKNTIKAVELVKSTSDILILVSSIVIEANSMLKDKLGAIN